MHVLVCMRVCARACACVMCADVHSLYICLSVVCVFKCVCVCLCVCGGGVRVQ